MEALERSSAGAELGSDEVPVSVVARQCQLLQLQVLAFTPGLSIDPRVQKVLPHQPKISKSVLAEVNFDTFFRESISDNASLKAPQQSQPDVFKLGRLRNFQCSFQVETIF